MREIRVIDDTGEQLGIMSPQQALVIARDKGLDLVEISPTASPPVCRIMDYGRYHYQEQKRSREARKNQKSIELKEIKFRPKVDQHDYNFKKKHIERIVKEGDKVKATIFFRGREMAHPDFGRRILDRLVDDLDGIAMGRTLIVVSHDLRFVTGFDHILVMEEGQVTGQGTHEKLLAECPTYNRLWSIERDLLALGAVAE